MAAVAALAGSGFEALGRAGLSTVQRAGADGKPDPIKDIQGTANAILRQSHGDLAQAKRLLEAAQRGQPKAIGDALDRFVAHGLKESGALNAPTRGAPVQAGEAARHFQAVLTGKPGIPDTTSFNGPQAYDTDLSTPSGGLLKDTVYRELDGVAVDQFGNAFGIEDTQIGYRTRFSINVLNEDKNGGHTYEFHVGKSDEFMVKAVDSACF